MYENIISKSKELFVQSAINGIGHGKAFCIRMHMVAYGCMTDAYRSIRVHTDA